ncbi:MAG: hypothetical protein OEU50_24530, partial [Gammaproteobacteria bacterium]|nr:hypothetical protein [Gammaproteobacteria bacterium]
LIFLTPEAGSLSLNWQGTTNIRSPENLRIRASLAQARVAGLIDSSRSGFSKLKSVPVFILVSRLIRRRHLICDSLFT